MATVSFRVEYTEFGRFKAGKFVTCDQRRFAGDQPVGQIRADVREVQFQSFDSNKNIKVRLVRKKSRIRKKGRKS